MTKGHMTPSLKNFVAIKEIIVIKWCFVGNYFFQTCSQIKDDLLTMSANGT